MGLHGWKGEIWRSSRFFIISDLHFGDEKNYDPHHVRNIINAIRNSVVDATFLLVVISGDLSYEGKPSQYTDFDSFLNELKNSIETNYSNITKIEIVLVPGNHDVDQTGGVWSRTELEAITSGDLFEKKIDEEILNAVSHTPSRCPASAPPGTHCS